MTLRRKFTGAKHDTEAMDLRKEVVGERSRQRGRMIERTSGACGRENAGVSSGTWVRIPRTEDPRFPEEGSSALGKSGPKARPRGVADGQRVDIPVPGCG